jgi:hypothetical protein
VGDKTGDVGRGSRTRRPGSRVTSRRRGRDSNPEAREGAAFRGHVTRCDRNRRQPTDADGAATLGEAESD